MQNQNHKIAISIIILALIVAGGVYWMKNGFSFPKGNPYAPEKARAGSLIEGFDSSLILSEGEVVSSLATNINEARVSYVTVVNTEEDYKTVYFKYVKYMRENEYEVASRPFYTTHASIFATKGVESLSVNISPRAGGGSQLTLTWVNSKQI